MRTVALTRDYSDLWESASPSFTTQDWANGDKCLRNEIELPWASLDSSWSWHSPLRLAFSRRQAHLEIDVLVAQALGLTLAELVTIYRVQFPVMRAYELADEYDAKGHRLPNTTRKDPGGKELRAARATRDPEDPTPLTVSWQIDNGLQTVTKTYTPPFTHVDREEDYRVAWEFFEDKLNESS